MKIAQISCTFPPYAGGLGNSVYNLAQNLSALGHEVTVFTPDYNITPGAGETDRLEIKFKVVRLKSPLKIGNAALLPQLVWKLKGFDVVHLHYPCYGALIPVLVRKIAGGRKFKLIMHYHMDSRAGGIKGAVFYLYKILILPLLIKASGAITCASLDYLKHSDLRKFYLARPEKFRQILFGVNLEQFVTYHDDLNKKRTYPVLLFVGGLDRAHYFKGLINLLKALILIRREEKYGATVLNVVGRGNMLPYYKKLAAELGLNNSVFFHERVSDGELVDFYNYSDCLILPSINRGEAFGLVLLEAMACSRPVITSNLPGVRSVFKNGKHGLLVKPGDTADLAAKIRIILSDREKAAAMGRAGRELVENKYTWIKAAKRLNLIYHRVIYSPG